MLGDMLMPDDGPRRVEVITGGAGRRYWPASETLRIVEEGLAPWGASRGSPGATGWRRTFCSGGSV